MILHIDDRVVLKRLRDVAPARIIELMNNRLVRRHLPLARGLFGPEDCAQFVASKESMWRDTGYGPWAIEINGTFAGWGGVQPEGKDADVGLVLHPNYWGEGRALYEWFLTYAFEDLGLDSVITLLPPSRRHVAGIGRLGFRRVGEVVLHGERFTCYRLNAAERAAAGRNPTQ